MSKSQVTVTLDSKIAPIFMAVGAAVGCIVSFLVGPVVSWMLERFDSAPLPLRLLDVMPWSIPVLAVLGAIAGWVIFTAWDSEIGRVEVDDQQVRIASKKAAAVYTRDEIAEIFLDKDELILVDEHARELSRTPSEAGLAQKLSRAFTTFDYPWAGTTDPRDDAYINWTDRSTELEDESHALLRKRRRALEDKRLGEADAAREELASRGIMVRDRDGRQQYRLIINGKNYTHHHGTTN